MGGRGASSGVSSARNQKEIDKALEYYVSGEGMYVNAYLAGKFIQNGGIWNNEDEKLLKLMDAGTNNNVTQNTLYRSVDASAIFGNLSEIEWENLEGRYIYGDRNNKNVISFESVKGKTFTEPRFMSTTTDKNIALDFQHFTGADHPIVLELKVPRGIKGADLRKFDVPENPQKEILLARKQKYVPEKIRAEQGQLVVTAQLIHDGAKSRKKKKK